MVLMTAEKTKTLLVVASAVLWLVMVGLAASGDWLGALYTLLPLLLIELRSRRGRRRG